MGKFINLIIALFILAIGEYFIYQVAIALDIPPLIKWLAIVAIPLGALAGLIKRLL